MIKPLFVQILSTLVIDGVSEQCDNWIGIDSNRLIISLVVYPMKFDSRQPAARGNRRIQKVISGQCNNSTGIDCNLLVGS